VVNCNEPLCPETLEELPVTVKLTVPEEVTNCDAGVIEAIPNGNAVGAKIVAVPANPLL